MPQERKGKEREEEDGDESDENMIFIYTSSMAYIS